jgi:serine/threonine protein phosphatase PrpC
MSNGQLNYIFGLAQSVGQVREHNEDAVFAFGSHIAYQDIQTFTGLFIVADGMGGHADGELASGLAVRTISSNVLRVIMDDFTAGKPGSTPEAIKTLLMDGIQKANQAIHEQVPGGGTTLTAVLISDGQLNIAHVGDSRAYLVRQNGSIEALTRDHSFVRQLVELGKITEQEAAVHPQRNILSMALGQLEPLEPDFITQPVPANDAILICSDGLWGVLPEGKLLEIIHSTENPKIACDRLIQAANQAGGPDNISAILISFPN